MATWKDRVHRLASLPSSSWQVAAIDLAQEALGLDRPKSVASAILLPIKKERGLIVVSGKPQLGLEPVFIKRDTLLAYLHSADDLAALVMSSLFSVQLGTPRHGESTGSVTFQPLAPPPPVDRTCVDSPYTTKIIGLLSAAQDVVVVGKSASGKTVAATQAYHGLQNQGTRVLWTDMSDPDRRALDVLMAARDLVDDTSIVLFVDDGQANPTELAHVASLVSSLNKVLAHRVSVAVIGWESSRVLMQQQFPEAQVIPVSSASVLDALCVGMVPLSELRSFQLQVSQITGGDLVTTSILKAFYARHDRLPTSNELARCVLEAHCGKESLSDVEWGIILKVAALGQYEIDTATTYLEGHLSGEKVAHLTRKRILRPTGRFVNVGHRSLARLLVHAIKDARAADVQSIETPQNIALQYLRASDASQLITTLDRLDVARLARGESDQHGARFLGKLWQALRFMLGRLDQIGQNDSFWQRNTGAAVFAASALNEFRYESGDRTVGALREMWHIEAGKALPGWCGTKPSERGDFDQIAVRMKEEEASGRIPPYAQGASEIDLDRMHQTWVIGLLLSAETSTRKRDRARLDVLQAAARLSQLPNGSFYPARVPWVTARVLLGLSQAGETIESSDVVRRGCDWLLTPAPEGPFELGVWRPYTGTWNTDLGTTAMCVQALLRCGIDASNDSIDMALAFLQSKRAEWTQDGHEIDGMFALENFLGSAQRWRDFQDELSYFINWAMDPQVWEVVVLDPSKASEESLKIPFIAASFIQLIWGIVRLELPLLLEDLVTVAYLPDASVDEIASDRVNAIRQRCLDILRHIEVQVHHRQELLAREAAPASVKERLDRLGTWRTDCTRILKATESGRVRESEADEYEQKLAALSTNVGIVA